MKHLIALIALASPLAARESVSTVTNMQGLVAFWDFVKREPDGARRFTAHVPAGSATDYPLDVANYVKDYWGVGREPVYADRALTARRRRPNPQSPRHSGPSGAPLMFRSVRTNRTRPTGAASPMIDPERVVGPAIRPG